MHSDRFNRIEILQGRWQYGEKVGYCYPSGLEKTLCKWDINVPLVTKGLRKTELGTNITFLVKVKCMKGFSLHCTLQILRFLITQ
jgi:hypothetical protein